jgi:hypothetical protein
MSTFEETMNNSRMFLTYSLAMSMLAKSAEVLAGRGADKKALSFITTGMELLADQLDEYADKKQIEEDASSALQDVLKKNGIDNPK